MIRICFVYILNNNPSDFELFNKKYNIRVKE